MLIVETQTFNLSLKKMVQNYEEIIKRYTYVALTDERLHFLR